MQLQSIEIVALQPVKCRIDRPVMGATIEGGVLEITGWVYFGEGKAPDTVLVQYMDNGDQAMVQADLLKRPDVSKAVGLDREDARLGFRARIDCTEQAGAGDVIIWGTSNGELTKLAILHVNNEGAKQIRAFYTPVLVTSLGRSGSTMLMDCFHSHPDMNVFPQKPYEVNFATRTLYMLEAMLSDDDAGNRFINRNFTRNLENAQLRSFLEAKYKTDIIETAKRAIDEFYFRGCGKLDATYFAEKMIGPRHTQTRFARFYPNHREIVLVRDFRDQIASARSFNRKRGFLDFGESREGTFTGWVQTIVGTVNEMVRRIKQNPDIIVLKYEDVVAGPDEALGKLFAQIGCSNDQKIIDKIIDTVMAPSEFVQNHSTSPSVERSQGRWEEDFDTEEKRILNTLLRENLSFFGYPVSD